MKIDAAVICVDSLHEAVTFWTESGGMEIVQAERGWVEVEHPTTRQRLRLVPEYGYTQAISIQTDDLDGVIAEMERLLGARVVNRGAGARLECAQLEDPSGVRYGVCQPTTENSVQNPDCGCS